MNARKIIIRATLLIASGVALIVLYLLAVKTTGYMPRCIIKDLTGFDCPGCGSQRALHALIAGHPAESIRHNMLLPFTLLYLAICALHWVNPGWRHITRLYTRLTSPLALWIIVAVVMSWMIIRNIGL